jgi:hypothetical protein
MPLWLLPDLAPRGTDYRIAGSRQMAVQGCTNLGIAPYEEQHPTLASDVTGNATSWTRDDNGREPAA